MLTFAMLTSASGPQEARSGDHQSEKGIFKQPRINQEHCKPEETRPEIELGIPSILDEGILI